MRTNSRRLTLAFFCLSLASGAGYAADPQLGRTLYETHCGTCHYLKLHDRKNTLIDSYAALKVQVARWAAQTGHSFTPAELDDITEYLNQSRYQIAK